MSMYALMADRRQLLTALAGAIALPSAALGKRPRHAAMRALVDRYVAEKRVPSVVVAVGGHHGPPIFISAGHHELGAGPLAGPDTLYGLNSMTKPITAFAIMALIEDGKLSLDTPLADIFPAFAQMRVLTDPANSLAMRPAVKPITIRHLVTHTAGLAYDFNTTGALQKLYEADGLKQWRIQADGTRVGPSTLAQYAEAVAQLPLLYEPGTAWKYSIGLDACMPVIERLAGMPVERFLTERLFMPLRMRDTMYTVPADKLARLSAAYRPTDKGLALVDTAQTGYYRLPIVTPTGGGGLVSSARDYARFMAMLLGEGQLDGIRVLKTETARTMMSNLMEPGVIANTSYGDCGYGAGGRSTLAGTPGKEGVATYGWGGSSNTYTWVDRANGIYLVMMTQIRNWYPNPIYTDFGTALYADLRRG